MQKFSKRLKIVSEILLLLPATSFCAAVYPKLDGLNNSSPNNSDPSAPFAPSQSQISDSGNFDFVYPRPPPYTPHRESPPPYTFYPDNGNQPQDSATNPLEDLCNLLPDDECPTRQRPNDAVGPNNAVSDANGHQHANRDASRPARKKPARKRGNNKKNRGKQKVEDQEPESEDLADDLKQITLIDTSKVNMQILRCLATNSPTDNRKCNFYKIYDIKLKMILEFLGKAYETYDYGKIKDLIKIKRRDHQSSSEMFYYFKGFSDVFNAKVKSKIDFSYRTKKSPARIWRGFNIWLRPNKNSEEIFSNQILDLLKDCKLLNTAEMLPINEVISFFLHNLDYLMRSSAFVDRKDAIERIKTSILAVSFLFEKLDEVSTKDQTLITNFDGYRRSIYGHYFRFYTDRFKRDTVDCVEGINATYLDTSNKPYIYNLICSFRCIVAILNFYTDIHFMVKERTKKAEGGINSHLVFLMSNLVMFSLDPTIEEKVLSDLLQQSNLWLGNKAKPTKMLSYEQVLRYFRPLQDILKGLVPEVATDTEKRRRSLQFDKKIKEIFVKTGGVIQAKSKEPVKAIISDSKIDCAEFYTFVDIVLSLTGANISSLKHQDQNAFSDPNSIFASAFNTSCFKNSMRLVGKFPRKLHKAYKIMSSRDDKLAECSLKSFIEKSDEVGKFFTKLLSKDGFFITILLKQDSDLVLQKNEAINTKKKLHRLLYLLSGILIAVNFLAVCLSIKQNN